MTAAEYSALLQTTYMARELLAQLDLPAAIAACSRAEALGPILDPTLYRAKHEAMGQDRHVLAAALAFVRSVGNAVGTP